MELATNVFKNEVRMAYERARRLISTPEIELAYVKLAKRGNVRARNVLLEKQLPALIELANGTGYAVYRGNAAELVAAVAAIMDRAIELFDVTRGIRFWTFLANHARNAMNKEKYEDSLIHVPENLVKAGRRDEFAKIECGHAPIHDDSSITLLDTIKDDEDDTTIFNNSVQGEYKDITDRLLTVLDSDEKYVVNKTFLECEPDDEGNPGNEAWSISSLAKHVGKSKEIIARRRKTALAKLRKAIDDDRDWCIDQAV